MAIDKVPCQSSFKLQAPYASGKGFPELMLPAKHGYETWEMHQTFSFMLTRGKIILPLCAHVSAGTEWGLLSYITWEMLLEGNV